MQRALVFLGVVLAVVIIDWLDQRREASLLRTELSEALSALSADPDSIKRVEATTDLGPGGVDFAAVSCPAGYRIVYGSYHSVSPDNAEIFFSARSAAREPGRWVSTTPPTFTRRTSAASRP